MPSRSRCNTSSFAPELPYFAQLPAALCRQGSARAERPRPSSAIVLLVSDAPHPGGTYTNKPWTCIYRTVYKHQGSATVRPHPHLG